MQQFTWLSLYWIRTISLVVYKTERLWKPTILVYIALFDFLFLFDSFCLCRVCTKIPEMWCNVFSIAIENSSSDHFWCLNKTNSLLASGWSSHCCRLWTKTTIQLRKTRCNRWPVQDEPMKHSAQVRLHADIDLHQLLLKILRLSQNWEPWRHKQIPSQKQHNSLFTMLSYVHYVHYVQGF